MITDKKEKKALFLDMDGTTLDDAGRITQENMRSMEQAVKAGHEVIITTGRPETSAGYLLKNHRLDEIGCRYVLSYNGGMLRDYRTGETIFEQKLPLSTMRELVQWSRETGIYVQFYRDDQILTERGDENLKHYLGRNHMMRTKVVPDLYEALDEGSCKALAIHLGGKRFLEEFCVRTKEWAEDKADMYFSDERYLEIVPKGVCKGQALREFCRRFGIREENTIAVGDENNDISMIQAAGVGCAVANGLEKVKAAADYVTERDNNHSAVAEVVKRFMLQGNGSPAE